MKEEREKKKEEGIWVGIVIISTLILLLFIAYVNGDKIYKEKLKKCKASTIAYTYRLDRSGKHSNVMYCFYVDSIKFIDQTSVEWEYNNLYKYYEVKYNSDNPEENIIFCKNEIIPDSITLVKAGFKKKKSYYYDDITATYKEKWEWK